MTALLLAVVIFGQKHPLGALYVVRAPGFTTVCTQECTPADMKRKDGKATGKITLFPDGVPNDPRWKEAVREFIRRQKAAA